MIKLPIIVTNKILNVYSCICFYFCNYLLLYIFLYILFKVVLPLMEKYFSTHRNYFIAVATATNMVGAASLKEKEMVAALFCKLANLLRSRLAAFGADVRITVRCLQVLVKAIDAKSLVKNCPEFIRTSMLTFFNNTADDLAHTIVNLQEVSYYYLDFFVVALN